jgi:hypothetical protein
MDFRAMRAGNIEWDSKVARGFSVAIHEFEVVSIHSAIEWSVSHTPRF